MSTARHGAGQRGDPFVVPILVVDRAFDLAAYDYVVKPFGMNELLARIRKALRMDFRPAANARSSLSAI